MLANSLVRSRDMEDAVGEGLDLPMLDRKPKSLLGKDPIGQVFFLIGAELLHHLGLVLTLWLGVGNDSVSKGRKGDPPGLASLTDRLSILDSLDCQLNDVFASHSKDV